MPRLTELQIRSMRAAIVGVPERQTIALGYPPSRRSRRRTTDQQAAGGVGEAGALPIDLGGAAGATRLWPFYVSTGAISRATAVSPRYVGPGLIDMITLELNIPAVAATPWSYVLYVGSDPGGGGISQAIGFRPSGVPIFDAVTFENVAGGEPVETQGPAYANATVSQQRVEHQVGYRVMLPEFFVKFQLVAASVAAGFVNGFARIVEGMPAAPVETT